MAEERYGDAGIARAAQEMQSIREHRDECIKAAAATIVRVAMNLVYSDPHQWSMRPCATCKSVTALLGEPFGCYRFQAARSTNSGEANAD